MNYIKRLLLDSAYKALARGKSILLLGARQTGKTTFIQQELKPDLEISFVKKQDRLRYEKNPELLEMELESFIEKSERKPVIFIDEIQKVPAIMDPIQHILDQKQAQFILSGSSARKLKSGQDINLLPGRVVCLNLGPLTYQELPEEYLKLQELLLFGSLPAIVQENLENRELDLASYITAYLEDEIRTETVIRNIGNFANFLQFAAGESGKICNMAKISQDVGVAATTISNYFQILVDCLIVHRIEPLTNTTTKRRLIHAPRYLFFDLGIRRVCANEGTKLPAKMLGELFEQYIGLQLIALRNLYQPLAKVRYWRDSAGPEIDYVLDIAGKYIPIEVKYSNNPNIKDAKHLLNFIKEYDNAEAGYIICQTPREYILHADPCIKVLPWQALHTILI